MKETDEFCDRCGRTLQKFDIVDPETNEVVGEETCCPDEWRQSHDRVIV